MLHHVEDGFPEALETDGDETKIYLVLFFCFFFKYPNDVRFSMLIITHPQNDREERGKKDRASLKWIVLASGTRTISPHRQQPRNVSYFHPSLTHKKAMSSPWTLNMQSLFCRPAKVDHISSVHNGGGKKSLHDRTNTFFDKSGDVTAGGGGGFHITDAVEITI